MPLAHLGEVGVPGLSRNYRRSIIPSNRRVSQIARIIVYFDAGLKG